MELKILKKQHLTVSKAVQMLSMIFSLQLLATTVIIFSQISLILYYYILFKRYLLPVDILFDMLFLLYTAYLFIKMILIVWACETGKNQAQQISSSIYDALNSTTDEQIKDEVV